MGGYLGGIAPLSWVVVSTINRPRTLLFIAKTGLRVRSIPTPKIAYIGPIGAL